MAISNVVGEIITDSGSVSAPYYGGESSYNQESTSYSDSESRYDYGSNSKKSYSNSNSNLTPATTKAIQEYNPYANGVPQSVIDAENYYNSRTTPNQEYANATQQAIIDDYIGYQNSPDYQGKFTKEESEQLFQYLSERNDGQHYSNWATPPADDQLFTQYVPYLEASKMIYNAASAQQNSPLEIAPEQSLIQPIQGNWTQAQLDILNASQIKSGDWNTLNTKDKFKALSVPSTNIENTMENAPWYSKFIQNIMPSVLASGAGSVIGGLIGGTPGAIAGGVIVGGLTYLQGVTNTEIPVLNDLLNTMDILSIWFEQGTGAVGASGKAIWDKVFEDGTTDFLELAKTTGEILQDFPDLWEVSQLAYEVGADLGFDNVLNLIRNGGALASDKLFGTDFGQVDTNTVSRANLGLGGLVEVNPETRGYDSLTKVYLPIYQAMRDEAERQGMTHKEAGQFALENISELLTRYMGTTGLANDFGASSLFDPMNLAPFVSAKTAEAIGKKTGDSALVKAAKAAQENASPIVDAFSVPGLQPIVEFITGKQATQGLDTIRRAYTLELQRQPVDTLSSFQRRIAGIDNNGLIKGYEHETNAVKRWFGSTEEAKMFDMSSNMVSLMGSILFGKDTPIEMVPELMSQFAGISPITDDSPLAQFRNSGILNTIQTTLGDVTIEDIREIQKNMDNYHIHSVNRKMVDTVAEKLHMTIDQVFDALDDKNKKMELKSKIEKNGVTFEGRPDIIYSPEEVFNKIDVFSSDQIGRKQYSETLLKVDIMEKFAQKSENALLDRYEIKPDKWYNRLGELTKSVQSIALLNFSPSYFVNNFLNNILTRSVAGVGGIDSNLIKTANAKRGLFYSRDGNPIYDATADKIKSKTTKNDAIGKMQKAWSNLTDDKKPLGKILKGFGNINIESVETRAAFEIGANRYWEATWKPGGNIPDIPIELQTLGITPEMNQTIYKVAMDSANLTEFKQKLMGDVILPGAVSTLSDVIGKYYSETTGNLIKNMIDSMPWITESVSSLLETGNPDVIEKGFADIISKFTNDVDLKLISQLTSSFEDLVNSFSREGLSAVSEARGVLDDLYGDLWIQQTRDSADLFHKRMLENLWDEEKFRPQYEDRMNRTNADYMMSRKFEVQYLAAMIEGIGLSDDIAKKLVVDKLKQFDIEAKYIIEEHKLMNKYADKDSPNYDYDYYKQAKLEMCQKVLDEKLEAAKEFDSLMVQYLRENLDLSYTAQIDEYEKRLQDIHDKKANLNAKEIEWLNDRLNDPDKRHKEKVEYDDNSWERYILKSDIQAWQRDANAILSELEGGREWKYDGNIKLTAEQTLALELLYREAKLDVDNWGEFLEHYSDKSDSKTVFEPADFRNTNVNESFVDYARRTQDAETLAAMKERYANGDAVPLGSVDVKSEWANNQKIDIPTQATAENPVNSEPVQNIGTEYKPINENFDTSDAKFSQVACDPFYFGDHLVKAGVYEDGKLIAYATADMPDVLEVNGYTFPVIGYDIENPDYIWVYVADESDKIVPGQPNNIDYTPYAESGEHPMRYGTTPTIEPWGTAAWETSAPLRELLGLWRDESLDALNKATQNGSFFGKLTPEQQKAVYDWTDTKLRSAYNYQRFASQQYGNTMVDLALLNYKDRHGFDSLLTTIMPYQYWITRSVMNWGARMIDQPKWFSMYSRINKLMEKNKRDFLPSRLEGMVGIPMPFMPEGQGQGIYYNPFDIMFPFKQFYNFTEYFDRNLHTIHKNAISIIEDHFRSGKAYEGHVITPEEYKEAMEGKGSLYAKVFNDQRRSDETNTGLSGLVGSLFNWNILVSSLTKTLEAKALGKNPSDMDISYTPMYKLGNTLRSAARNTAAEQVFGFIANALQLPDKAWRSILGIESDPIGSNWTDYWTVKYLSNMLYTKEHNYSDVVNAIAEGESNPLWQEARDRYATSEAYKQQGGLLLNEIIQSIAGNKETSAGQIAGSALVSLFGGRTYPEGEYDYRRLQELYHQIKDDPSMYREFWNQLPEYKVGSYARIDDKNELLHTILVDDCNNAYYALPETERSAVRNAFGKQFTELFLDKETRATDQIDDRTLIEWTRAMHGNVPNISDKTLNQPMQDAIKVQWYADSVQGLYDRYLKEKKEKFPGIDTIEQGYYSSATQAMYKAIHPELQKYWDWKEAIGMEYPQLASYMKMQTAHNQVNSGKYTNITEAVKGQVNNYTKKCLENHINKGWSLPASAQHQLKIAYTNLGVDIPYETWLKEIKFDK